MNKEKGMKCSIKAVCFVVLACIAVSSAMGNEVLTSIILESFNGDTVHEWNDGRHTRSFEFSWSLVASRLATQNYPRGVYVAQIDENGESSWPIVLYGRNPVRSLGINGRFDRQGYHWIDLYPVNWMDGTTPFEIPIPGRVRSLSLWVRGSGLNFYIESYVRDTRGVVHRFSLGDINSTDWRRLDIDVPENINNMDLRFVKFRIWISSTDSRVLEDFYIYFNQFSVGTDTSSFWDGEAEIPDEDTIRDLWNQVAPQVSP